MVILLSHLVKKIPVEELIKGHFSLYEIEKRLSHYVPKPVLLESFLEKSDKKVATDLFYRDKKVGSNSEFYKFPDAENEKSFYLGYTPFEPNDLMLVKNVIQFAMKNPKEAILRNLFEENTKKDYFLINLIDENKKKDYLGIEQKGNVLFLPKNYNLQHRLIDKK